ncbi:MAG: YfhO family protein [Saprospiraceae bacterium]|nr:YfhO family protein [Saprospiraceae bacterium]
MKSINIKELLPHLIIVVVFYLIATIYFLPALKGKVLQQSDFKSWQAMAHESIEYNKTHSDIALWSDNMFGGMPLFQTSMASKNNFLGYLQLIPLRIANPPINTFFALMLFSYLGLIFFGLSTYVAALCSLVLAFSTGNILLLEAGHLTKLAVIGFASCVLVGFWASYCKNRLLGLTLYGFGFGMQVLNNHVQMTYYLFLGIVPFFILLLYEAIKDNKLKEFGINTLLLALITIVGLLASATTILTTKEYVTQTMRGGSVLSTSATSGETTNKSGLEWDYATQWSNGILDLASTIIPGVAGGGSSEKAINNSSLKSALKKNRIPVNQNTVIPGYWGELPFTGGPFYFGIVIILLYLIGAILIKDKIKWWFIISSVLLLLMSLGKNFEIFNQLLFNTLPFLNKFRAPSSILTIVAIYAGIFGFYTLSKILKHEFDSEQIKKAIYISGGFLGMICIFFWIIGPGFFDMSKGAPADQAKVLIDIREAMMTGDALRGLLLVLSGSALILLYSRRKMKENIFLSALGILILFDLLTINSRYITSNDFITDSSSKLIFQKRKVDEQILNDKTPGYRVFDATVNTYNSSIPSYYHHTIGGYHPAKLRRYQDIIDHCLDGEMQKLNQILQGFNGNPNDSGFVNSMNQLQVLNMLNTKYFILGEPQKEIALPNSTANGSAWFVNNIKWVQSADEEIEALKSTDLKHTAVIHNEWKEMAGVHGDGTGSIALLSYSPNELKYTSESSTDQIAVLSEIWYGPNLGWTATIDGNSADLFRSNYVLRALKVPAGKHEIILSFKPKSFFIGETLSAIFSLLLIGLIGISIWINKRNKSSSL